MINHLYKMRNAAIVLAALTAILLVIANPASAQNLMNPDTIVKWLDPMPIPGVMQPITPGGTAYHVGMYPIQQQYHANWPMTNMYAYGESKATATSPGKTFIALRGTPITVNWTNNLVDNNGNYIEHMFPIDRTIPWADPKNEGPLMTRYDGPIPTCVHLHGGEVAPGSDGHYESWFTPVNPATPGVPYYTGPTYSCAGQTYTYANSQPSALIWYHDHAFGIDRLNVMAGLFGGYAIVDPNDPIEFGPGKILPVGDAYDIPVIVQDRFIDTNYQIAYQGNITNPSTHPFWFPEFFGNIIVVNGKVWPTLTVEPRKYRLRFLNGSNARFYHMYFTDTTGASLPLVNGQPFSFMQIATDGGFLPNPVVLTNFLQAPAERMEFIVDFAGRAGQDIYIRNDAAGPYPTGDAPGANSTSWILRIHVGTTVTQSDAYMASLTPATNLRPVTTYPAPTVTRNVVLYEKAGPGGPLAMYLDGVDMSDPRSIYKPILGTTERWNIINTTMDAHPMHWHLAQFKLLQRQVFDNMGGIATPGGYFADYNAHNPIVPIPYDVNLVPLDVTPYLDPLGITPPNSNELNAWKDTWICPPSQVSSFIVRWGEIETGNPYVFDAAAGPGYVWHCHILEHEENAMMREIHPENPYPALPSGTVSLWLDPEKTQAYGPVNYTNMMPKHSFWADQSGYGNYAVQNIPVRQPMHDGYGINCHDAIMFMNMGSYGTSDYFTIPYSSTITSDNANIMTPQPIDKSLFLIVKPNMMMGRQVIFEAGKTTSGFNVYLDNNYVIFGMWNRLERKFVKSLTPLVSGNTYLLHMQYDALSKQFRAFVNGTEEASAAVDFLGFSKDTNATSIGGEAGGTRYHDYSIGSDYGDNFDGNIGDVLLYNTFFTPTEAQLVYNYLNAKYTQNWTYPAILHKKSNFMVYEEYDTEAMGNQHLISAYPNPVKEQSVFSMMLDNEQMVNIELYNSYGQKEMTIFDGTLPKGDSNFNIDGTKLLPGLYIIKARGEGFVESGMIVVVK